MYCTAMDRECDHADSMGRCELSHPEYDCPYAEEEYEEGDYTEYERLVYGYGPLEDDYSEESYP